MNFPHFCFCFLIPPLLITTGERSHNQLSCICKELALILCYSTCTLRLLPTLKHVQPVFAMASLTPAQTAALVIVERTMSFLSLFGNIIVFALFASSESFRKPIHRMMFYACIGNVGMNVATLISEGGVAAGQDSFLCQFQGFLIQM
jgi:hypothetical protein